MFGSSGVRAINSSYVCLNMNGPNRHQFRNSRASNNFPFVGYDMIYTYIHMYILFHMTVNTFNHVVRQLIFCAAKNNSLAFFMPNVEAEVDGGTADFFRRWDVVSLSPFMSSCCLWVTGCRLESYGLENVIM